MINGDMPVCLLYAGILFTLGYGDYIMIKQHMATVPIATNGEQCGVNCRMKVRNKEDRPWCAYFDLELDSAVVNGYEHCFRMEKCLKAFG
jgi:hypothetical protein